MKTMKITVNIAFFTAFMYVLGLIPSIQLSFISVPIVLQNMGVFLAASILGMWGGVSIAFFLLLVIIGFPLLPGGRGGFEVFFGPTGGYLIGYLIAAFLIGAITQKFFRQYSYLYAIMFNILGMIVIYILGIPFYANVANIDIGIAIFQNLPFVLIDFPKVIIASAIAVQFKKYYPLVVLKAYTE